MNEKIDDNEVNGNYMYKYTHEILYFKLIVIYSNRKEF